MSENPVEPPESEEDLDDLIVEESTEDGEEGGYVELDEGQDITLDGVPLVVLEDEEPDFGPEAADGGEED